MHRNRSAKILATLGPATSGPERVRALHEAGADAVGQLLPRHARAARRALPHDPRRRGGARASDRHRRRPAGPQARIGRFGEGRIELAVGQAFRLDLDPPRRPQPHRSAASGSTRCCSRAPSCCSTTGASASVWNGSRRSRRDQGPDRGAVVRQQGRERAAGGPAHLPAHRQGSARSAVRARSGRRLDRAQLRAAAGGRRRSAPPDRRPRRGHGQGGEARGGRSPGRDHRSRRRHHDRARRSRRGDAARGGARPAEADDPARAPPASRSWSRPRCWSR